MSMHFLLVLSLCCAAAAQSSVPSDPIIPTFHVGTSLTEVDVVAERTATKLQTRKLLTDLKQSDFRVFDNDREVPIKNFDVGGKFTSVPPIALWLIVQCNEPYPASWNSQFLKDRTRLLKPALPALQPDDVIGVAHWCDDGAVKIDLAPTSNSDAALSAVEAVLHQPAIDGENRLGELALQELFGKVLGTTQNMSPRRLPIFLFLYGDHSATYVNEAENIIEKLLESSGIVFGLIGQEGDVNLSVNIGAAGQVSYLIHRYASETGGQFYTATKPELFASALAYMLTQIHLRYVLSFRPVKLDGKRHTLRVELTKEAKKTYGDPELRFRTEYVPVAERR